MSDAAVKIQPRNPLTHQEMMFNLVDFEPNVEVPVAIVGPISQAYEATLKTDGLGTAQLIWRTQAAGDYTFKTKGDDKLSESFTVDYQEGERQLIERGILAPDSDVKTVEDPDAETPKTTPKKTARKTTRSKK